MSNLPKSEMLDPPLTSVGTAAVTETQVDLEYGSSQISPRAQSHLRLQGWLRPLLCEMFGIMTMVLIGCSSNLQAFVLQTETNGVAYAFGWGVGLMLGLLISIDVSGGHLNPAISLSQAMFRGFEWRLVLPYAFFQVLGGFLGAAITLGVFSGLLDTAEGGGMRTSKTVGNFVITVPEWQSNTEAFFTQFVGAGMLLIGVAIVTHPSFKGKTWVKAMIMHWTMTGVSGAMGVKPAFSLNPARDLGPRIACAAFGYSSELWTGRRGFFFWGCIAGPVAAGIVVTFLYDLVVAGGVRITIPALERRGKRRV